jgi:UTP--glucose-1-phosphate uridylyltransferase
MKVSDQDVSKYGIADLETEEDQFPVRVRGFVEKPKPEDIKSRWALPGRYIFTSAIFEEIQNSKPGVIGEIQLTDAMNALAKKAPFFAFATQSQRYDAGDKLGYLIANIELALRHPELGEPLKHYLQNDLKKILN